MQGVRLVDSIKPDREPQAPWGQASCAAQQPHRALQGRNLPGAPAPETRVSPRGSEGAGLTSFLHKPLGKNLPPSSALPASSGPLPHFEALPSLGSQRGGAERLTAGEEVSWSLRNQLTRRPLAPAEVT